jgi:hypothetical protein
MGIMRNPRPACVVLVSRRSRADRDLTASMACTHATARQNIYLNCQLGRLERGENDENALPHQSIRIEDRSFNLHISSILGSRLKRRPGMQTFARRR